MKSMTEVLAEKSKFVLNKTNTNKNQREWTLWFS